MLRLRSIIDFADCVQIASTSAVEGQNWRHGDIEDTLLTLVMSRAAGGRKFKDLDVKRVYFGNWLRDYSQAVDVGTVKSVSAEAIRILLWVLGFLSFGYGTKEFEVTRDRLGCYRYETDRRTLMQESTANGVPHRPEEHIDNPKDYADNIDARQYDRRLRGPVDERRELAIDPRTGLKMYIASEDQGITTSAGLVRNLFGRAIDLGRSFARTGNKDEWYEALRLLGTGCHCLEDFPAHSNYTELALRALGEKNVFPHVGRNAGVNIQGTAHPSFPIVTGTFGGVDFFHSVLGELSDKTTQSEIQELEGSVLTTQRQANKSMVQQLLNSLPSAFLGGKDQAGKADELEANATAQQMKNTRISPRQPEEWTNYLNESIEGIRPILEFHDEIMKSITETIEKIPLLPDLIDKLQDQINIFVFSLLAPYVLPIIKQVKTELATGSSQVIKSSRDKQLIVFRDDSSTDPTHSMLSKDHFSNVLNEPAGKVASQILKWVVPQIINCMDNENEDIGRTLNRIVTGVFHHPTLRGHGQDGAQEGRALMFSVVETWWHEKSEQEKNQLRRQLSREGVESGKNHKEGVRDKGHGCCKPLGMPTMKTSGSSGAIGGPSITTVLGGLGVGSPGGGSGRRPSGLEHAASEAVGGGILGSVVGGIVGSFAGEVDQGNGGHAGHPGGRGGGGGGRGGRGGGPPGRRPSPGRAHSPGKQPAYQRPHESYGEPGGYEQQEYRPQKKYSKDEDSGEDDYAKREKKARKKAEKAEKKARKKAQGYGSGEDSNDSNDSDDSRKSGHGGRGGRGHSPPHGGGGPHRGERPHRGNGRGGGESGSYGGGYPSANPSYATSGYDEQSSTYESQANPYPSQGHTGGMGRYEESTGAGGWGGQGGGADEYGQQRPGGGGGFGGESYGSQTRPQQYGGREDYAAQSQQQQYGGGGGRYGPGAYGNQQRPSYGQQPGPGYGGGGGYGGRPNEYEGGGGGGGGGYESQEASEGFPGARYHQQRRSGGDGYGGDGGYGDDRRY